jgi:hypothetical protein
MVRFTGTARQGALRETRQMENQHESGESVPGVIALQAVSTLVERLECAIEVLSGRESGDATRTYAVDVMADESIEHVQRAVELLQECTEEVGRALWFLRRQAVEGAIGHGT